MLIKNFKLPFEKHPSLTNFLDSLKITPLQNHYAT